MKRYFIAPTLLLALFASAAAQKLPEAKLTPSPLTEKQQALIREGVALHNRGQFEDAINKYQEVLQENSANELTIYEIAYSYFGLKNYAKCIEYGLSAAKYKSSNLGQTYVLLGNCFDEQGDSKRALEVYNSGLKQFPNEGSLFFNQAITLNRVGKPDEARVALKKSAALNPNHTSTQLFLASLFSRGGYKVPSLLASSRFLILEPNSRRSTAAFKIVQEVLQGGVERKDEKNINIFINMNAKKDEGDFGSIDLILGLTKAASMTEENKNKSEMARFVDQFETLLSMLDEDSGGPGKSKFTVKYYIPYFAEMKKRKLVETFCYIISASSGKPEVSEWLEKNQNRIGEFMNWSTAYKWPPINEVSSN